jgi:putative membrane protein
MRQWLSVYLKGVCMGAADSVPGVSGGTIALITGIYERLVAAIAAVDPSIIRHLAHPNDPESRLAVRESLTAMDLPFLVVLGAGIATALVSVTRVVLLAYRGYPAITYAFFSGLIAASAVVLYRHVEPDTPGRIGAAVAGLLIAFFVSGASATSVSPSLPAVFLLGALAISAMVLPGISGAFILLLFGQWVYMTDALHDFVDALVALASGGGTAAVFETAATVVTFVAGALVGVLTVARVVDRALDAYREATLAFLVSLMVGALRFPVERVLETQADWTTAATAGVVLAGLVGAAAVLVLDRYTDDLEYGEVEGIDGASAGRAD